MGAKLAIEQMNAKGGILGRQVELLVEDSANDVGTGVQKTRKLIERDNVNCIIGDVNSGIAIVISYPGNWFGQVSISGNFTSSPALACSGV